MKNLKHAFSDNVQEVLTDIAAISKVVLADEGSDEYLDHLKFLSRQKRSVEVVEFMRVILTIFAEYGHIENLKNRLDQTQVFQTWELAMTIKHFIKIYLKESDN